MKNKVLVAAHTRCEKIILSAFGEKSENVNVHMSLGDAVSLVEDIVKLFNAQGKKFAPRLGFRAKEIFLGETLFKGNLQKIPQNIGIEEEEEIDPKIL